MKENVKLRYCIIMCVIVFSVFILHAYTPYALRPQYCSLRATVGSQRVSGLGFGVWVSCRKQKKISSIVSPVEFRWETAAAGTDDERLRLCLTIRHTVYTSK